MTKTILILAALLLASAGVRAKESKPLKKCSKEGYQRISCEDVAKSKRKSFCYKGEIKPEKKQKICKTKRKHKKRKAKVTKN